MAGPWERYAAPAAPAAPAGPWTRFAAPTEERPWPPAPPPGAINHGASRSYIAARPEISTARAPDATERENAAAMEALKLRGANGGAIDAAARGAMPFVQGVTMGGADEAISGLAAAVNAARGGSAADAFDTAMEYQRQELERQRAEAPLASAAGEIAGGVTTGLGMARAGLTGANAVAAMVEPGAARAIPLLGAGAAEGAAYGGVAGFLGADGSAEDRAHQAASNAGIGAGLGAVAPVISRVVGAAGRGLSDAYKGWRAPETRAEDLVVRGLLRDGQAPEDIAKALEAARAAGQPDYLTVDAMGRNSQRIGAVAAKTPGPFRDEAARALAERQIGQHDRIAGYVGDAVGPGDRAFATEQALAESRRTSAQPLYDAAYAHPPPSGPAYDELMAKRSVQDATATVRRVAEENNQPLSDLFVDIPNPNPATRQVPSSILGPDGQPVMTTQVVDPTVTVPTTRGWDLVKRALDKQVDAGFNSTDASQKYAAATVRETRDALRSQLAADNPDYAAALARYADDTAALEAVGAGRDLVKASNADEAAAAFRDLPPGEKDLARIGAAREMTSKMGENRAPGADRAAYFASPGAQKKLDVLVDDPRARALLEERLARERDMGRSRREMFGGSSTAENLSDAVDAGSQGGALAALFSGHFRRALGLATGTALNAINDEAGRMNEQTAKHVGEFLMSADPDTIRGLAELFVQTRDAAARPRALPTVISAGFNAPRSGGSDR